MSNNTFRFTNELCSVTRNGAVVAVQPAILRVEYVVVLAVIVGYII